MEIAENYIRRITLLINMFIGRNNGIIKKLNIDGDERRRYYCLVLVSKISETFIQP